jgi:hypothetical protein
MSFVNISNLSVSAELRIGIRIQGSQINDGSGTGSLIKNYELVSVRTGDHFLLWIHRIQNTVY